jgi:hypothetical protein
MACALTAHADVISASSSSTSSFLSGWTTGSGASVIGSGVLSGNVSLVGGIAYGASDGSLADALIDKASSSLGAAADGTELFYSKGIEGVYLLGKGHGILAAMLGNGVSVIGSSNGVVVKQGSTGAQAGTGSFGGAGSINVGGGKGTNGGAGNTNAGTGGGGTGGSNSAGGNTGAGGLITIGGVGSGGGTGHTPSTGGGGKPPATGGGGTTGSTVSVGAPIQVDAAVGGTGTIVLPSALVDQAAATVPEPSTIALMLAGVFGAGLLKRRRG